MRERYKLGGPDQFTAAGLERRRPISGRVHPERLEVDGGGLCEFSVNFGESNAQTQSVARRKAASGWLQGSDLVEVREVGVRIFWCCQPSTVRCVSWPCLITTSTAPGTAAGVGSDRPCWRAAGHCVRYPSRACGTFTHMCIAAAAVMTSVRYPYPSMYVLRYD